MKAAIALLFLIGFAAVFQRSTEARPVDSSTSDSSESIEKTGADFVVVGPGATPNDGLDVIIGKDGQSDVILGA